MSGPIEPSSSAPSSRLRRPPPVGRDGGALPAPPPLEKIPLVSLTWRPHRRSWRILAAYRIPGENKRRYERLGTHAGRAVQRAQAISEALLDAKAGVASAAEVRRRISKHRKLADLADEYERHLKTKGNSKDHIRTVMQRIREFLELSGASKIEHLDVAAADRVKDKLRERDNSPQTINHKMGAARAFGRWLSRMGHVIENPLSNVEGVQLGGDLKIVRRAPRPEEVGKLYQAVKQMKRRGRGMLPWDRAMLYLIAFGTGLRAKELRRTQPGWFRLDVEVPVLHVPPKLTKNKKGAMVPLPSWLVRELRPWLLDLMEREGAGGQAFRWMSAIPARIMKRDLKAAGVPFETPDGRFDFHALRTGFTTQLQRGGADIRTAQIAARHADAMTTLRHYSKAQASEVVEAIEKALPDPLAAAATGSTTTTTNQTPTPPASQNPSKKAQHNAQHGKESVIER